MDTITQATPAFKPDPHQISKLVLRIAAGIGQIDFKYVRREVVSDVMLHGKQAKRVSVRGVRYQTASYRVWYAMMQRSRAGFQANFPTYLCVRVSDEFSSFEVFSLWAQAQPGFSEGYEIDKDLLSRGNLVYGSSTCCFLPKVVNLAIRPDRCASTGVRTSSSGKFVASYRGVYLGTHKTFKKARAAYKRAQVAYIKLLAKLYRSTISDEAYKALLQWK